LIHDDTIDDGSDTCDGLYSTFTCEYYPHVCPSLIPRYYFTLENYYDGT